MPDLKSKIAVDLQTHHLKVGRIFSSQIKLQYKLYIEV